MRKALLFLFVLAVSKATIAEQKVMQEEPLCVEVLAYGECSVPVEFVERHGCKVFDSTVYVVERKIIASYEIEKSTFSGNELVKSGPLLIEEKTGWRTMIGRDNFCPINGGSVQETIDVAISRCKSKLNSLIKKMENQRPCKLKR